MIKIFKNTTVFTVLYFGVLILDILVKTNLPWMPYRFITKPLIVSLLSIYYIINSSGKPVKKHNLMLTALTMFLIGDIVLIFNGMIFFGIGMVFFLVGRLFYTFRFIDNKDFDMSKIIPFLIGCFIYMIVVMSFVYDSLGSFFVPIVIYIFIALITFLFAYVRNADVGKKSYWFVFYGVVFSVFSDTTALLSTFYNPNVLFKDISLMLFYGISQYLIIVGITSEKNKESDII